MSNSIWKTPDQKPESRRQVLINDTGSYYVETAHPEYWDDKCFVDKWCYVDDLIAQADKAERLLEIAERQNDILQDHFATLGYSIGKEVMDMSDEIKQLIKED